DNGCGAKTIQREWVVYFTNKPSVRKTCTQVITLTAPTLTNCPSDVVLSCDNGNTHTWNAPTVSGACGGTVVQTSGPTSGSVFPVGTTMITYQIGDGCTNQTCSFTVTITEGGLTVDCQDDVILACEAGQNGATYSWTPPTATSCCNSCPEPGLDLTDFVYMGTLDGHQYYCSREKANWATAKATCESQGGHLAVINSAAENQMLSAFLKDQSAYIGLSDREQEGTFKWCNNDPVTYTNWYPGQPDNYGGNQDVTRLFPNGVWDDIAGNYLLEYILEIPCLTIQQCEGPASGSVFPVGTTEVAYHIEDNCGNEEICKFNVTVNPCDNLQDYCDITGKNTTYFWIRHVVLGGINNATGTNSGYGDYSNLSTNLEAGSEQSIVLSPGYASSRYYVNWRVWIDYNRDGDFDDSGEELFTYRDYRVLKIKFNIPNNCAIGQTRMRVSMKYGNPADYCQDFTYGEVEDYTINLVPRTGRLSAMTTTSTNRSNNDVEVEVLPDASTAPVLNFLPTELPTMALYPNPVSHDLQVQLSDYQQANGRLKIYNNLGQVVHEAPVATGDNQRLSIPVNHLPTGMYLLSIEAEGTTLIMKKFSKQ
ncbi:MAG: HYR domain-containing protein, partial [Saprospiraceae bacterium]